MSAVCARGLEKRFGAVVALRGVDLEVPDGRCAAVLGPNGAGKSTLLRILAGLTRASRGELRIGDDSEARGARARALVGYVGHATLIYPELTARENLVFAARLHGVERPHERADALLEAEELSDVAHGRAGTWSRGMSQRLSIARALVHDPRLVLLDEPFTGLDRSAAGRLADRLARLCEQGRSCVLVTHDLEQASRLAQEAIVLVRGRVAHRAQGEGLERAPLEAAYNTCTSVADANPEATTAGPGARG